MRRARTFLVNLLSIFIVTCQVAAQESSKLKSGVVKIYAYNVNNILETGAGVVVGRKNNTLYIVTALHVIKHAAENKITVRFHNIGLPRKAKKFEKVDKENDLAVLIVENFPEAPQIELSAIKDPDNLDFEKEEDEIFTIGHPGNVDWDRAPGNLKTIQKTSNEVRFSSEALDMGNSGGALFSKKENLLIGIVVSEEKDGIAIKIDYVEATLKEWAIPFNLKRRNSIEKWLLLVSSSALISGGVAILATSSENNRGNEVNKGSIKISW